ISGANQYYLYDTVHGWQDYTAHTTFNPDGRSVTVELKDGGHGDSDGVANGIIVDPGGVAGAASGGLDSGAGSGCFIATAALDSYVEPHVKLQAASYLEEQHDWLKPIVRILLMPLVGVSYILVRTSLAVMILVGFLLIISAISFYMVTYRRRKYQA
ncbi:MAG: choice-of-anchor U domain-containing protein, partial [Syntrophobacteria bacterium]